MAGCGSDEQSTAKSEPKYAAVSESADVFIKRMAKLLETSVAKKDCAQLEEINGRSLTRFPCPTSKDLRRSMASFELVGAEEYGTGGVVDYRSGEVKDGGAILLFAAPDRNWGISRFGIITKPSTETGDEDSREGFGEAVDAYLAAVGGRDCAAFKKVAFLGESDEKEACKTMFAATEALAKRLKANPSAEPEYQGGNGTYGFFTLETQKPQPENSTISVVKDPDPKSTQPFAVLDVVPSPTAAEQRRVLRQFKQQQRKKSDQPKRSRSRKADS